MRCTSTLVALLLVAIVFKVNAGNVISPQLNKTVFVAYEKVELSFNIDQVYSNPYDTDIVQVDAEVTMPGGSILTVPCFYYVPATVVGDASSTFWNATEDSGQKQWKLRYSPVAPGNYSIRIKVNDGAVSTSNPVTFNVNSGIGKGFIRVDSQNKQFLRFDNQSPYYPVGLNLCWNSGTLSGFYADWITNKLVPNKVNWTRYWLTDFARQALEWKQSHWSNWYSGLGTYSQKAAGVLDEVIAMHEEHGIYMQLVLQHHGQVSSTVNAEWADNPYNTANGGFLTNAGEFFTNAQAKEQTKKLYRYIVARWGYSQAILSWELFNEVEFSDGTDAGIDAWHDEMSHFIKGIDVNKHLISTSSGGDDSTTPLFDDNTAMDVLQWHTYSNNIENAIYSGIEAHKYLSKSSMNGEFGTGTAYPEDGSHPDNWGDHVRKAMWTGMMNASPAMFWFWKEYIDVKNLSSVFKPLGSFLEGIDLVKDGNGTPQKLTFASAPVISGAATVTPGNMWQWGAYNVPNPFTSIIGNDGSASNTAGLTNYIHGSWQGDRNRSLNFNVTFSETGDASLFIDGVSGSGDKSIQVYLDDALMQTWVPAVQTFTLGNIPAGNHTIRFYNSGQDWIQFSKITFSGVLKSKSLEGYGYSGTDKAYGYIINLAYGEWASPDGITPVSSASIEVPGLEPGSYNVTFTNPVTGSTEAVNGIRYNPLNAGNRQATGLRVNGSQAVDPLILNLPAFIKDVAYKVEFLSPLPVKLISFSAQVQETDIVLQWSTTEEMNNNGFQIERSPDAKLFKTIGFVKGNGSQQQLSHYSFADADVIPGKTYYYRLRQQDFDGKSEFSVIISAKVPEQYGRVYPNPNKGNFIVSFPGDAIQSVELADVTGRRMPVNTTTTGAGIMKVQTKSTPKTGIYFLKIRTVGDDDIKSRKVIIE
ncbi:T9SS type A sorting domain-containing protein [Dyadobacter sp. CY345]|uniref:T9SS type A sorting domain-containing protein n=1 Tax=Dyadobacter sp. CY345 TaxID=2909335 RepID=UPI001F3116B7|nr:T9SS type A sorting domain-containing protein [Dyadobacter sp. CY345]MCF2446725.1 T9SS type A sorting domain-containing protein [Dyadobacter sp. CY345]